MTAPLLHKSTTRSLEGILKGQPQAILLIGPAGSGKATVANWLAAQMLEIKTADITSHPQVLRITPIDNKAIGIDEVRRIEHFLSLRATSDKLVSRMMIIEDAQMLGVEAQNALLKTLEEPPAGTVLLLTATQRQSLLPTILSRTQAVHIVPPSRSSLEAALNNSGVKSSEIAKIMALSGGLPGLAFALATDDTEHPLVAAVKTARELLQQSTFEKLCQVDRLTKDKISMGQVIAMLGQLARAGLLTGRSTDRWQRVIKATYDTEKALLGGTQPKLAITNLMLNL